MSRVEEARARAAEELARAEVEDAVLAALPLQGRRWLVHGHGLYGTVAGARLEADERYYPDPSQRPPAPTLDDVLAVAAALPPVPAVVVRDGCLSFRPAAAPLGAREARATVEPVAPAQWHAVARLRDGATEVEVAWCAQAPAGLLRVSVALVHARDLLGQVEVQWRNLPGERVVRACRYAAPAGITQLPGYELVRWASGGPQYANRFTCYWRDPAVTAADVVAAARGQVRP